MATIFSLNDLGVSFQFKLTDCINSSDVDISDITEQFIIFRKPDGVSFEKNALLAADPENPSQIIPGDVIIGNGIDGIITVTMSNTNLLKDGEIMSISFTNNFDVVNVPLTIIDDTTFTYNLGSVGSTIQELGVVTTQGEFLISYTNTAPETESILDPKGNWEYAGKVKISNNDSFETRKSVFWVN